MKLYLRRQMVTSSKGMFARGVDKTYSLYARLELTPEERQLANDYDLSGVIVLDYEYEEESRVKNVPGDIKGFMASVGSLVQGDEFACPNIGIMLEVQTKLQTELKKALIYFELARDIKNNSETVVDIYV